MSAAPCLCFTVMPSSRSATPVSHAGQQPQDPCSGGQTTRLSGSGGFGGGGGLGLLARSARPHGRHCVPLDSRTRSCPQPRQTPRLLVAISPHRRTVRQTSVTPHSTRVTWWWRTVAGPGFATSSRSSGARGGWIRFVGSGAQDADPSAGTYPRSIDIAARQRISHVATHPCRTVEIPADTASLVAG